MTRRHHDPVEVRTRIEPAGPVPDQFLWRGRLYCVREVLARWTESGSWWRGPAVRAVAAGAGEPEQGEPEQTGASPSTLRGRQGAPVVAGRGRLRPAGRADAPGPGVYDLCFEERTASWSLTRVMD